LLPTVQSLRIDELLKNNEDLSIKLELADVEIGNLKLEVDSLKDGILTLTVKLADSDEEVARQSMKLKYRVDDIKTINLLNQKNRK